MDEEKLRAAVVGCTGMVGQRFCTLLADHPWFKVTALAASARSAGRTYGEACQSRWKISEPMPPQLRDMELLCAEDVESIAERADVVFCAVDMPKEEIRALEERYARAELAVISNNSAHRWTPDVPMVIPEINPQHTAVIEAQRRRLGTRRGFIAVKPNCSIQCYVPVLTPLLGFGIQQVQAVTFQAISGAGKAPSDWPEMRDNVIPFIGGEEEKSQLEPLRVWGTVENGVIHPAEGPNISAQCIRVPVSDGHMAAVSVSFACKPSMEEILSIWQGYQGAPESRGLPSSPEKFITYYCEDNMPQTALCRGLYGGMGISAGRLREDSVLDYKFVCVSHNTLRGAAGGAVLTAELLRRQGWLEK